MDLSQCTFVGANLQKVRLQKATLAQVDFTDTDLRGAKLNGSDFYKVIFNNTDLRGADLRFASSISSNILEHTITNEKTILRD
jgi:uncharacterized protein YjbI with pentapeptide repeats